MVYPIKGLSRPTTSERPPVSYWMMNNALTDYNGVRVGRAFADDIVILGFRFKAIQETLIRIKKQGHAVILR